MKKTILPAIALALTVAGTQGALLAYDGFETTSGDLNGAGGGTGWAENWVSSSANTLAAGSLTTPTDVPSSGGHLSFSGNGSSPVNYNGAYRMLNTSIDMTVDATYYFSVAMTTTSDWVNIGLSNINGGDVDNATRLGTGNSLFSGVQGKIFGDGWGQSLGSVVGTAQPLFAVLKIDAKGDNTLDDTVSVKFFDTFPTNAGTEPIDWDLSLTKQSSDSYDAFFIQRQDNAPAESGIDEIRIGTTWEDVTTTVPEPSSSALLGLGGLALLFRRRK